MQLFNGGLTRPLKRNVPYTNSAKPSTCSHLNVSHPRNSDTIQMKSVRQVSMVDREVALTVRVTERPKKLKPLRVLAPAFETESCTYPMLIMMRMLDTAIGL